MVSRNWKGISENVSRALEIQETGKFSKMPRKSVEKIFHIDSLYENIPNV